MASDAVKEAMASMQRLTKWRAHFAGWLFGTRSKSDPQMQWARDVAERLLIQRVELNALAGLMIAAGVFTQEEFTVRLGFEAEDHMRALEERWPGVRADDNGLVYDGRAAEWMKDWLP